MGLKIFGYAGCTTVKKAVTWARETGLEPDYRHFNKVDDLEGALRQWIDIAGIDKVFNAKAQTFKKLPDNQRAEIQASAESMIKAMAADPRFIKRPVGTDGKSVLTGFDITEWQSHFS